MYHSTEKESGIELVCSKCGYKIVQLKQDLNYNENYVRLRYLTHIRNCKAVTKIDNENEDIKF